jgi:hypothetical protein
MSAYLDYCAVSHKPLIIDSAASFPTHRALQRNVTEIATSSLLNRHLPAQRP